MNKILSIITVNWNNVNNIDVTLRSIFQLDKRDCIEWVVIDGGSSDGSAEILMNSGPDIFISEPDNGIYDAMNKGLNLSSGDYVVFMNSGDAFANKDVVNHLIKSSDGDKFISFAAIFVDGKYKYIFKSKIKNLLSFAMQNPFCHQSVFYKRNCLIDIGGYNLDYKVSADFDATLRYYLKYSGFSDDAIMSICSLGGFSCNNKYKSLFDRFCSIVSAKNNCLLSLTFFSSIFYLLKIFAVNILEKTIIMKKYRALFKGVKNEK